MLMRSPINTCFTMLRGATNPKALSLWGTSMDSLRFARCPLPGQVHVYNPSPMFTVAEFAESAVLGKSSQFQV